MVWFWLLNSKRRIQNREVGWLTKNRKTGELVCERQSPAKKVRMMLLFNPLAEWIDSTRMFGCWLREKMDRSQQE